MYEKINMRYHTLSIPPKIPPLSMRKQLASVEAFKKSKNYLIYQIKYRTPKQKYWSGQAPRAK